MLAAAAQALAELSGAGTPGAPGAPGAPVLPPVTSLRVVSAAVAVAVARAAEREGLADVPLEDPAGQVDRAMWMPGYPAIEAI
jgi:malate dehydrogenase (oxaloacetate-decarboxylating)